MNEKCLFQVVPPKVLTPQLFGIAIDEKEGAHFFLKKLWITPNAEGEK